MEQPHLKGHLKSLQKLWVEWLTYGVYVGVITIVDHEDATYPPSVEHSLRAADNVQKKAAGTTAYMPSKMLANPLILPILSVGF